MMIKELKDDSGFSSPALHKTHCCTLLFVTLDEKQVIKIKFVK